MEENRLTNFLPSLELGSPRLPLSLVKRQSVLQLHASLVKINKSQTGEWIEYLDSAELSSSLHSRPGDFGQTATNTGSLSIPELITEGSWIAEAESMKSKFFYESNKKFKNIHKVRNRNILSLRALTLGGKHIEPIHSDEVWFMENVLRVLSIILFVFTLPFSLMFCFKVVAHYERAVVFRLGRLHEMDVQGPGLIFLLPCLDRCQVVDLRTFTFDVPTQEVLTKDSLTVAVNAVVYYRVRNPICAIVNVEDANRSTRLLGQTTLRNILGTVSLDELLSSREDIAILMQECLDSVTESWGVKVERVDIKDVRLPIQLQRSMAAEAEAARESTARVISAEGEMHASRAFKLAAIELSKHPIALQIRYLQTMSSISFGKQSTIIFPVPIDMLKLFNPSCNDESSLTSLLETYRNVKPKCILNSWQDV